MTKRRWSLLILLSIAVSVSGAVWVQAPGYMDADYYFATARYLSAGAGFEEPFLWNYLDDPAGLPHPSHLYWMPLTSLLSTVSMSLLGATFRTAQVPFLVLTSLLPLLVARFTRQLTGAPRWAWQAGLLSLFSGYYLPFFLTTDSFSLFAMLGGLFFWTLLLAARQPDRPWWVAAGSLIAFGHLARADGFLLWVPALVVLISSRRRRLQPLVMLLLGYAFVYLPWGIRNLRVAGTPFSPGGFRVLWLLSYDELFSFPPDVLTFGRWWEAGLTKLFADRLGAFVENGTALLVVNGLIFLGPLMVLGARRFWSKVVVRAAAAYLAALFLIMSIVFPFIGARGAFFHSSAAVMPVLWALAPAGLEAAVDALGRWRRWDLHQARNVLGAGAVGLAVLVTFGLYWSRMIAPGMRGLPWGASHQTYTEAGRRLTKLSSGEGLVAVNNPPGFYLATGREAVVIPNGSPQTLQAVCDRYAARWVLLEANHPAGLDALYQSPESQPWLTLQETFLDLDGQRVLLLKVRRDTGTE